MRTRSNWRKRKSLRKSTKYLREYRTYRSMRLGRMYWVAKGYECGKYWKEGRKYYFNCYK